MLKGKLRIGVAGIGFGQHVHIPAFRLNQDCEVVGVCASTRDRARAVADRTGVGCAFGDWREMIEDSRIDAVTLALPPALQTTVAIAALGLGKPVFCEKPLAISVEDAAQMVVAADSSALANMVDFEFPELPAWRSARELLRSGIGELRNFSVSWSLETYAIKHRIVTWKNSLADGGGVLFSFVSHVFYNLEWLAGRVKSLGCLCSVNGSGANTCVKMFVELESGAVGSISVSNDSFLGAGHRWEFYGASGAMVLSNVSSDYMLGFRLLHGTRESSVLRELPCPSATENGDGRVTAVNSLVARFVEWARGGHPATPDLREGLRVQKLLDAALLSHSTGRRTSV